MKGSRQPSYVLFFLLSVLQFLNAQVSTSQDKSNKIGITPTDIRMNRELINFLSMPSDTAGIAATRSPLPDIFQGGLGGNVAGAKNTEPKRAVIIGASAGMGRAVAKLLAADGYIVGLAARRLPLLQTLQQEISTLSYVKQIDASKPEAAVKNLEELIQEMGGLDLLVLSITGFWDVDLTDRDWTADKAIFDVDVMGFYALARTALNFFEKQGHGHLVGFSSLDGLRGIAGCPVYSAAKAFCSRLLEAERNRCIQKGLRSIFITDIIPGWVNSKNDPDFSKKNPKAYWIDSLEDASRDIFQAIKNKETVAYITRRWEKVAKLLPQIPDDLYNALGGL